MHCGLGPIPSELGLLSLLTSLYLNENVLTGKFCLIIVSFGSDATIILINSLMIPVQLVHLNCAHLGRIPAEVINLPRIANLNLELNEFDGNRFVKFC